MKHRLVLCYGIHVRRAYIRAFNVRHFITTNYYQVPTKNWPSVGKIIVWNSSCSSSTSTYITCPPAFKGTRPRQGILGRAKLWFHSSLIPRFPINHKLLPGSKFVMISTRDAISGLIPKQRKTAVWLKIFRGSFSLSKSRRNEARACRPAATALLYERGASKLLISVSLSITL